MGGFLAPGWFSLLWPHLFSPTAEIQQPRIACTSSISRGLPSTLPILRSGFFVILRVGLGSVSCGTEVSAGAFSGAGWVLDARRWQTRSCVQGPCCLPSPGPQKAPLWCACSSNVRAVGMAPNSQCPCLKGTKLPPIRGCWGAL